MDERGVVLSAHGRRFHGPPAGGPTLLKGDTKGDGANPKERRTGHGCAKHFPVLPRAACGTGSSACATERQQPDCRT
jgi:hypothetical protein